MAARADTFNRADAGTLGTPSDAGSAWLEVGAQAGIASNQCVANYGTAPPNAPALECSTADYSTQVTVAVAAVAYGGPVVRRSDHQNYIMLAASNTGGAYATPAIVKVEAGVVTSLATCSGGAIVDGDVLKLEASGTTITAYKNAAQIGQATGVTFNQTVTKHGFGINSGTTLDSFVGADVTSGNRRRRSLIGRA